MTIGAPLAGKDKYSALEGPLFDLQKAHLTPRVGIGVEQFWTVVLHAVD